MSDSGWLDLEAASQFVRLRADAFLRAVKDGRLPKPSYQLGKRTPRWDRTALDSQMRGGTASLNTREAVDALVEEIKAEGRPRGAASARGRNDQRVSV